MANIVSIKCYRHGERRCMGAFLDIPGSIHYWLPTPTVISLPFLFSSTAHACLTTKLQCHRTCFPDCFLGLNSLILVKDHRGTCVCVRIVRRDKLLINYFSDLKEKQNNPDISFPLPNFEHFYVMN